MKKLSLISLIALVLIAADIHISQGQGTQKISIYIDSVPEGALVSMNGQVMGRTDLRIQVDPGHYTFNFSYPGFGDASVTNYLISPGDRYQGVFVKLPDGPSFVHLDTAPIPLINSWINFSNQLRVENTVPVGSQIYDADTHRLVPDTSASLSAVTSLRQQFHLTDEKSSLSPSERYFAYRDDIDFTFLHLFDRKTGTLMLGKFPTGITAVDLAWSRNEQWALVGADFGLAYYIHLTDDQLTVIDATHFTLDTGEDWSLNYLIPDSALSFPSTQGFALVQATAYAANPPDYLCIVNLQTKIGVRVPVARPLSATFTPDEKSVYIMNRDGVSRYDIATRQLTWLSTDLRYMTGGDHDLFMAQISPTTDYAVVGQRPGVYYWVYKIPHPAAF